ncbi:MAG: VOC family protein [Bacteroidetes bacterium]|nr:VOC family protein [Bacteroidota bacterium]
MTQIKRDANYIPPNVLPRTLQLISPVLKNKWVRNLILLPSTLSGKRFSNKTADYGVFQPSRVSHLDQLSIYVKDIATSRKWYEAIAGMTHSRTCEAEAHPYRAGFTIKCCYMNAKAHDECLVLVELRNEQGEIITPSAMSFHHFALEIDGNQFQDVVNFATAARKKGFVSSYGVVTHNDIPPNGDGETGGNTAVYFYDPDYHLIEFCGTMDTIENYKERRAVQ